MTYLEAFEHLTRSNHTEELAHHYLISLANGEYIQIHLWTGQVLTHLDNLYYLNTP